MSSIDVHAHVTPPALLSEPGETPAAWRPVVRLDPAGRQVEVQIGGRTIDSIIGELSRVDIVLAESATTGISSLVVSPWVATLPRGMDDGAATDVCRAQNVALAEIVRRQRGRVAAFGAVPLQAPEVAAGMLGEVLGAGLVGVEITPSPAGRWLGDPALTPFWEAVSDHNAVVFVHPSTLGLGLDVFDEYYLWNAVANPFETATAAAHMIMAGVLERIRDLRVILAHGGGVLPALAGRLERAWAVRPESRTMLEDGPRASLRRLYFDTLTHDRPSLASLVSMVGAGQVMLGSDRPFDMGMDDPVAEVRSLHLAAADEQMILHDNALSLFGGHLTAT